MVWAVSGREAEGGKGDRAATGEGWETAMNKLEKVWENGSKLGGKDRERAGKDPGNEWGQTRKKL